MIGFHWYSRCMAMCLILLMSACAGVDTGEGQAMGGARNIVFSDPVDFIGVNFKTARPRQGEDFSVALLSSSADREALKQDLHLLGKMPSDIPLRVVGFTDSRECAGEECRELSLRRAKAITDWLIGMGIPSSRLAAPQGFGAERPIDDNGTEKGRARNRRAYVSYD
ncbi:OmpA family protein [Lysobacter sp. BMK333-48F3]|uniref:OmpA family protein n=1 Tax=Lysobacter sp. BMK333-48F3 TaxID=2867962 RepID=UPI001C8CC493|nr:OmpA family protein [Lysobacter sp. BMK333-48F3]MBX9402510.1 OmpA family protein [Lysobacter sp. BMK333-48F3]